MIIKHPSADITVNNIANRDNIPFKNNGMLVLVQDASDDISVARGQAIYIWDSNNSKWILGYKEYYKSRISEVFNQNIDTSEEIRVNVVRENRGNYQASLIIDSTLITSTLEYTIAGDLLIIIFSDIGDYIGKDVRIRVTFDVFSSIDDVLMNNANMVINTNEILDVVRENVNVLATKINGIEDEVNSFDANFVSKTSDNGSAMLPSGDTSQRDIIPKDGMIRFNEEIDTIESYYNNTWNSLFTIADNTIDAGELP